MLTFLMLGANDSKYKGMRMGVRALSKLFCYKFQVVHTSALLSFLSPGSMPE